MKIEKETIRTIEIKLNNEELIAVEKVVKLLLNLEDVLTDIEPYEPLTTQYGTTFTISDLIFMRDALRLLYDEGIAVEEKEKVSEELC